jgi:hypothetical protein
MGLCLFAAGCRLPEAITENLASTTCLVSDDLRAKLYYRHLAGAAWREFQADDPEHADSADFAKGFKQGFADYLDAGGDSSRGRLPPQRYWKTRYQTPEGRSAIDSWFAGFKAGAQAAKASGYRDYVVIPVADWGPGAPESPALAPGALGPVSGLPAPGRALPTGRLAPIPVPAQAASFPSRPHDPTGAEERFVASPADSSLATQKEMPVPQTAVSNQRTAVSSQQSAIGAGAAGPNVSPQDKHTVNDCPAACGELSWFFLGAPTIRGANDENAVAETSDKRR